jgi:hypothetical protein
VKFLKWRSRPELPGTYAKDVRAARHRKKRQQLEFWVKVATPLVTLLAVLVALYQAKLATSTTDTLLENSWRERIATERRDDDLLRALTSDVLDQIHNLPASPWLGQNASESEFNQGKINTLSLVQAPTKRIDGARAEISDPLLWEFLSLAERSFSTDISFEIAANDVVTEQDLASRKTAMKKAIEDDTREIKQDFKDLLRGLDSKLLNESFRPGQ